MKKQTVVDETAYFQLGQQDSIEYYQVEFGASFPSMYSNWPEKDKNGVFKFDSFYFQLNQSSII